MQTTDRLEIRDPGRPGEVVGYAAAASREQALAAVQAAQARVPRLVGPARPQERADLVLASLGGLADHHEADAEILTRENGKIRMESKIDLWVFNHRFELACGLADQVTHGDDAGRPAVPDRRHATSPRRRDDHHPVQLAARHPGASLPYALVAGNTVIVKPPRSAPLATARVVRRVAEALPPGVLNVVTGEDAEIGEALIRNEDVAKVHFTGSPARRPSDHGAGVAARSPGSRSSSGGNDPAVILEDALLDEAALGRLFAAIFDSTGQICMAAKRVYVHRSRYDEVVEGLSALLERTVLGHGLDEGTTMGPLHSRRSATSSPSSSRRPGTAARRCGSSARSRPS